MITTKFEDTYVCVATAKTSTKKLTDVVNFLFKQTKPLTCQEIGMAVFGEDYNNPSLYHSCHSKMGQILRHLRDGGFITVEEHIGEPMTIENKAWIEQDSEGIPLYITVHDDEGNTYQIPNPKANHQSNWQFCWGTVKKTIIPKTKLYKWVA